MNSFVSKVQVAFNTNTKTERFVSTEGVSTKTLQKMRYAAKVRYAVS
jgi:hypothetical protein